MIDLIGASVKAIFGSTAGKVAEQTIGKALSSLAEMLYSWMAVLLETISSWWLGTAPISTGPGSVVNVISDTTRPLVAVFGTAGLIIALVRLGKNAGSLEDRSLLIGGLMRVAAATGVSIPGVQLLMAFSAAFSPWIFDLIVGFSKAETKSLMAILPAEGEFALTGVMAAAIFLVGPLVALASIVQAAMAMGTDIAAALLSAILPITAAASTTAEGKQAFNKQVGWILSCALFKPAAAIIYGFGVAMISGGNLWAGLSDENGGNPLLSLIAGLMTLVVACFSLKALTALLVPMASVLGSSGGRFLATAGGAAVGAVVMAAAGLATAGVGTVAAGAAGAGAAAAGSAGSAAGGAAGSAAGGAAGSAAGASTTTAAAGGGGVAGSAGSAAGANGSAGATGATAGADSATSGAGNATNSASSAGSGASDDLANSSSTGGGSEDDSTRVLPDMSGAQESDTASGSGSASSGGGAEDDSTRVLPDMASVNAAGSGAEGGATETSPAPGGETSAGSGANTATAGDSSSSSSTTASDTGAAGHSSGTGSSSSSSSSSDSSNSDSGNWTNPQVAAANRAATATQRQSGAPQTSGATPTTTTNKTWSPRGGNSSYDASRYLQEMVRSVGEETEGAINPEGASQ